MTTIVGDVKGKIAVVVDDMISTGGTLAKAAEALIKRGATQVYTCATHGIFAGDARTRADGIADRTHHRDQYVAERPKPNLGEKFKVLSTAQIHRRCDQTHLGKSFGVGALC